jgi:hypothetical protein
MQRLRAQIVALEGDLPDISYSKITARAKQIAKEKEALLGAAFPAVYGMPFLSLYLRIDDINVELDDAFAALGSVNTRDDAVVALKNAGSDLKRLADLLRRQHGPPGAASTLDGLAIEARGLAADAEQGRLGPIKLKVRKLQQRLAAVGTGFPKIYGASFEIVYEKLQTIDSILEEQIPKAISAKQLPHVLDPKLKTLLLRAEIEALDLATAFANAPSPPTLSKYHFQGLTDQFTTAAPQNVTVTESFSGDFCGTDPLKGTWTITLTDPPFSKQPFKEAANFGNTNPFTANKTSTYINDPSNVLGTSTSTLELVSGTAPQMKLAVTLTGGNNTLSYGGPTQVPITVTPVAPCPPG